MGQTLSQPATSKKTESGGDDKYFYAVSEMQGWRIEMEDAHAIDLNLEQPGGKNAFFAVYDGHGGASVAKYAGENVHKRLISDDGYKNREYTKALKNAFLGTDADMKSKPQFQRDSSGCTAVAALATSDARIFVANAGDSRSVISVKGTVKPLSFDHKPQNDTEKSRILAAGGYIEFGRVNGNLALARALGDFEYKRNNSLAPEKQIITCDPEITEHQVTEEDEFLVIACDGIWDCLSSQQVVDIIRLLISQGKKLPEICEEICELCLAPDTDGRGGMGCDNMTVLIAAILHGKTLDEWYDWVTERTKQKYGYNTPEQLPQLYSNSSLEAFRRRREMHDQRQRERDAWRSDHPDDPEGYRRQQQSSLARVLAQYGTDVTSFNVGTGQWSQTIAFSQDDDDDDDDSGDEFVDADGEGGEGSSGNGGYPFEHDLERGGDMTKSLREQLAELEREGEADDREDAIMEGVEARQVNGVTHNLQGEAPPPPKPTENGDATPKQFVSTPGGDAPDDVVKAEGLMDTSEDPLKA